MESIASGRQAAARPQSRRAPAKVDSMANDLLRSLSAVPVGAGV